MNHETLSCISRDWPGANINLNMCEDSELSFDILHHKLPKSFDNSFKLNCDVQLSHQTRQSDLFYIERCDSLFVKRMPLFNFPIIWNKWIRSLSGHTTNRHIQNQMKKSILSGYADKVKCKNPLCRQCQALRL